MVYRSPIALVLRASWREAMEDWRGVTLPEVLISMAITALVMPILVAILWQTMTFTQSVNERIVAVHDVQNARYWLARDTNQAIAFQPLSAPDYGRLTVRVSQSYVYTLTYTYDASATALVRVPAGGGGQLYIARHIAAYSDVNFAINGKLLTVAVTSTVGSKVQTMSLMARMRPD